MSNQEKIREILDNNKPDPKGFWLHERKGIYNYTEYDEICDTFIKNLPDKENIESFEFDYEEYGDIVQVKFKGEDKPRIYSLEIT